MFLANTFCLKKFPSLLLSMHGLSRNRNLTLSVIKGSMTHVALATSCGCKGWPVGNWMRRFRPAQVLDVSASKKRSCGTFQLRRCLRSSAPALRISRASRRSCSAVFRRCVFGICNVHRDVRSLFRVLPRKDNGHIMLGVPLKTNKNGPFHPSYPIRTKQAARKKHLIVLIGEIGILTVKLESKRQCRVVERFYESTN